jgi:cytochrome c-type biogenesis protein
MGDAGSISLLIAFAGGFLSFVSPCVLPLLPSYVTFITGLSLDQLTHSEDPARVKRIVLLNSLCFVGGFSTIFVGLGASATYAGQFLMSYQAYLGKVAGVVIVLMGLYVMGVIKASWLMSDKRVHMEGKPKGYTGSYLVGMAFAAGWTPCVGPILGSILLLAGTTEGVGHGMLLLFVYSLGLAVPFMVMSLALNSFLEKFTAFSRYMRWVTIASGILLIIIGLMMFFDMFTIFSAQLVDYGIGWDIQPSDLID